MERVRIAQRYLSRKSAGLPNRMAWVRGPSAALDVNDAAVAQVAERRSRKAEVAGSWPACGSGKRVDAGA